MTGKEKRRGFTLVETVVFLGVFGVLAILATTSLLLVLGNMTKTKVIQESRRNGNNALQIMERQLRVAESLSTVAGECGGSTVKFTDQYGQPASFSCELSSGNFAISSGSGGLLLTDPSSVKVSTVGDPSTCQIFTCDTNDPKRWVRIDFSVSPITNSTRATEVFQSEWHSQVNIRYQ